LGIITIAIARYSLPDAERARRPLNLAGSVLYAGTFGLMLAGLQSLAHHSATWPALVQILAGLVLAVVLVRHELERAAPLIPFDLLRVRLFRLSLGASACAFIGQMSALRSLPFSIQRLGHTAVETGLYMTPWPVALALTAPVAGRLADRYPAGLLGGLGLLVMSAGLSLLAFFPAGAPPGVSCGAWGCAGLASGCSS